MEGNSVLHDREGEILTSLTGALFPVEPPLLHAEQRVSHVMHFKGADLSGKCHEYNSCALPFGL